LEVRDQGNDARMQVNLRVCVVQWAAITRRAVMRRKLAVDDFSYL
jgi:hypothetical protein